MPATRRALSLFVPLCLSLAVTLSSHAQAISAQALVSPASSALKQAAPAPAPPGTVQPGKQQAETGAVPDDASHQGVRMHGHWTIDIVNPDGKRAQHHEFDNSIQYDGQNFLIGLMSGYGAAGQYAIYMYAPNGDTSPCSGTSATYPFCGIVQSTTAQPGAFLCSVYYCVSGLTVTPTFGVGPTLKLAGNITAVSNGYIGTVATSMNACNIPLAQGASYPAGPSTTTPAACQTSTVNGAFGGTMTSTALSSPISVIVGQIIQVTVTISFS